MMRKFYDVSSREIEILGFLAKGMDNISISKQLNVSINSVKNYLSSLFVKLGARNRANAVYIALVNKLIK